MALTIKGKILDPNSAYSVGDKFIFISKGFVGSTPKGSKSEMMIAPDGSYEITLQIGKYFVYYIDSSSSCEPIKQGEITVSKESTEKTLGELLITESLTPPTDAQLEEFKDIRFETIAAKNEAVEASEQALAKLDGLMVSILDFGAVPSYDTDSTKAINDAIAHCHANNKPLYIPTGVYKYVGSLDLPSGLTIIGDGAPQMQPTPTADEKLKMRDGHKDTIKGSAIIFAGGANKTATLANRDDDLNSFSYMVKTLAGIKPYIRGVAFIQDMTVINSGGSYTTPAQQNAADYDVGHYIEDSSSHGEYDDVVVFGYFPKAGRIIHTITGGTSPDFNVFRGGSVMGRYGLALVGSIVAPEGASMTGTQTYAHNIFTLDHHSKSSENAAALYAGADSWRCIYIDGDVAASTVELNGFFFNGGVISTSANHAIELDHASNVHFSNVVFNLGTYGVTGSNKTEFIASINCKKEISFNNCSIVFTSAIFNDAFAGASGCPIIVSGDPVGGMAHVTRNPAGGYNAVRVGADGGVGDAAIQLTNDITSNNSRWRILADSSAEYQFQIRYDNRHIFAIDTDGLISYDYRDARILDALIVENESINITFETHQLTGASSVLSTINGAKHLGQMLTIFTLDSGKNFTVKSGSGNLSLSDGKDFELSGNNRILLQWTGSIWAEVSRSTNV